MSGNTSGPFPEAGSEKTVDTRTGVALSRDLQADDLVARAFAILAEEEERWRSARPVALRPGSSS
jgi:hypothetical protein